MVIFNGATGCLAEVLPENAISIARIITAEPGSPVDASFLDPDLLQQLVTGGFVVEDDIHEREFLRQVLLAPRYAMDVSYICLVPTTRCNFACPYCIQDTSPGEDMMPEVEGKILDTIQKTRSQSLSLTFYGGEPLLNKDTCLRTSRMARDICESKSISLFTLIVTNGYLLSGDVARELNEAGIRRAQVTIDGNRLIHDSRRILKNGQGTFERIVRNVREACAHLKIDIRMNLDSDQHSGPDTIQEVEECFTGSDNIRIYAAPTRWHGNQSVTARNQKSACQCFPRQMLYRDHLEAGIPGCCAVSLGSRVVLPNGDYVLCWDQVGTCHPDYGSILKDTLPFPAMRSNWMRWDPYVIKPCSDCRYLPTCRGSCPKDWLEFGKPFCEFESDEEYKQFILENYRERISRIKNQGSGMTEAVFAVT